MNYFTFRKFPYSDSLFMRLPFSSYILIHSSMTFHISLNKFTFLRRHSCIPLEFKLETNWRPSSMFTNHKHMIVVGRLVFAWCTDKKIKLNSYELKSETNN